MFIARLVVVATAVVAIGIGFTVVHAAQSPEGMPLRPLTSADMDVEAHVPPRPCSDGCTSGFMVGRKNYFQITDRRLMLRTAAGRQVCVLTAAQAKNVNDLRGSTSCGGVRFTLRQVGPVKSGPTDSDSGSARP